MNRPVSSPCCHGQPSRHRVRRFLCSLSLLLCALCRAVGADATQTNAAPLALWDVTARISAGGGYRGNVPLSSLRPEGSSLIEASADFSAIRISESGSTLTLFVLGELRRYLDLPEIKNEGILYTLTGWEQPVGIDDTVGADFEYLYQNEIMDVSETEIVQRRVRVLGNGFWLKPDWEHRLGPAWALKLQGAALRQTFEEELDDYWEGSARVALDHAYGRRSSVSVGYELRQRFYDTREQYDSGGAAVPGTDLIYRFHQVGGEWRHAWDAQRHWRTTLKAGFLRNEDNGGGYFNYDRVQASAQIRWRRDPWDARLQGRGGWYVYPNQSIQGEDRVRSYYALDLRVERRIDAHWLVYATASREWNLSNDPFDQYNDWVATGGLAVEL